MNLNEISYPVYRLREDEPQKQDGVLFYYFERSKDTEEGIVDYSVLQVIDDTNLPGDSLALRRLIIRSNGDKPYPLNRAIFFLGDLIKIAKPKTWFIDSKGRTFKYSKTKRAKLIYRKVTKLMQVPTGGCIVEVEGFHCRMKSLFPPNIHGTIYAGVLLIGAATVLYGFYDTKYKDTWRIV